MGLQEVIGKKKRRLATFVERRSESVFRKTLNYTHVNQIVEAKRSGVKRAKM